jgi:hypothetical protein
MVQVFDTSSLSHNLVVGIIVSAICLLFIGFYLVIKFRKM